VFVDQNNRNAFGFCLIGDVLAYLAMVPLRRLLVTNFPLLHPIRNIAHVTDHHRTSLLLNRHLNNRTADLVLQIAQYLLMLGPQARSSLFHTPITTTSFVYGDSSHQDAG
jgi:hypothetical protein